MREKPEQPEEPVNRRSLNNNKLSLRESAVALNPRAWNVSSNSFPRRPGRRSQHQTLPNSFSNRLVKTVSTP